MTKVIENWKLVFMNSPQPLSASQRGAKKVLSLLFLAREGGRGVEYMKVRKISKLY
jgi:hypothetical protein